MAKAMFIMDMPSSCDECPLFNSHYSDMTCKANGKGINYPYPKEIRQEWCPLREVPENKRYEEVPFTSPLRAWGNGWNACIDEILGGWRIVAKHRMPKTRAEFEEKLISAFEAGCTFGYGVEHTVDMNEQERLGAEHYVGRISDEEFDERIIELRGY